MPTFAAVSDLEAFVNQTLDDTQAQQALVQATGLIQGWTGQTLSAVAGDTVILDPLPSLGCFLPELPVTAVTTFQWLDDVNGSGWNTIPTGQYRCSQRGELYIVPGQGFDAALWPRTRDSLRVTYTHGYDPIPQPIQDVCIAVAARMLVNPFGVQSTRTGGVGVTYGMQLLDTEKAALGRYSMYGNA